MDVCTELDDDQSLAASRCRGWTVGDVIVHVHLGLQDMALGLLAPTNAEPDTDAANYSRAGVPTNDRRMDRRDHDPGSLRPELLDVSRARTELDLPDPTLLRRQYCT
jgi:hypothetical protein